MDLPHGLGIRQTLKTDPSLAYFFETIEHDYG